MIGRRHKIGGEPEFIQSESWPKCPACGERMTFYAQLDSIGDEFMIADCGLLYVFLCYDDYSVVGEVQSG